MIPRQPGSPLQSGRFPKSQDRDRVGALTTAAPVMNHIEWVVVDESVGRVKVREGAVVPVIFVKIARIGLRP